MSHTTSFQVVRASFVAYAPVGTACCAGMLPHSRPRGFTSVSLSLLEKSQLGVIRFVGFLMAQIGLSVGEESRVLINPQLGLMGSDQFHLGLVFHVVFW